MGPSLYKLVVQECSYYTSSFYRGFNTVVDEGTDGRDNINVMNKIVVFIRVFNGRLKNTIVFGGTVG